MILALGLAAALAAPPAGPAAVFYGGGHTWLVDVDAGQLRSAPGWITSNADGIWRYRLRRDAARPRPGPDRVKRPASRWTVFERLGPTDRHWTPLTAAPTVPAEGQIFAEHQVLTFTGDAVAWVRFDRTRTAAGHTDRISAATLDLPAGRPRPTPTGAAAAIDWVARALPGVVEPCVDRVAGLITLDQRPWLALTGQGRCADRAHAVPAGPAPRRPQPLAGATWQGGVLRPHGGPALDGVVDLRSTLAGQVAIALRGDPLPASKPVLRDLARLDDPCVDREVLVVRPGRTPRVVGRAARLDGLRWLEVDDPLRAAADVWFRAPDDPCAPPLAFAAPSTPSAAACRVDASDRPWRGLADLSAAAGARDEGDRLTVALRIIDDARAEGDAVQLYLGKGRRPLRVRVDADGVERVGRKPRGRLPVRARWTDLDDGARVELEIQRAALGDPPRLTVAVDDADPGLPGTTRLWVVGAPIDGRNPHATPLEQP